MNNTLGIAIIAVSVGGLVLALLWNQIKTGGSTSPAAYKYKARPLLKPAETTFFALIREALPEYEVFPMVSLPAFLLPAKGAQQKSERDTPAFNAIARKRAGFAICRPETFEVMAIVELDDTKNMKAMREVSWRDQGTASAGIPTIRWGTDEARSSPEIRQSILGAMSSNTH